MEATPPPIVPSPAPAPRPGWWSRNWKWFVPVGCLTFLGLIVVFVALLAVVIFGAMKSSDVYKEALQRAQTNPEVVAALGEPIRDGWFVSGKTEVSGGGGEADLAIPVSGPKGSGTIYAVAEKSAGRWNYSKLQIEVKATGQRIDLQADVPSNE